MNSNGLVDAFGHPIPAWAIWFHYGRVDVSTSTQEAYLPGELRANPPKRRRPREKDAIDRYQDASDLLKAHLDRRGFPPALRCRDCGSYDVGPE